MTGSTTRGKADGFSSGLSAKIQTFYITIRALEVFTTLRGVRYAYNEKGELVRPKDGEPIYAMKDGVPFLEIVSPSYEELAYSRKERRFEYVPSGTKFYHLASTEAGTAR